MSSADNVGLMLQAEGIKLGESDKINPSLDTHLTEDMNIEVIRVETKTLSEVVPVNFKEVVKSNRRLANTKRRVLQAGKNGEKRITYSVVYENGIEVSRTTVKEAVTKNPVDRVIEQGAYPLMPVSRGGSILPYSKVINVRATAYWAVRGVGRTYTASGRRAVRNPDGYSTIAVDPSIFPYGTKLFIEGYGFAIAADTGTAIVGNKIDVFFDTYREACSYGAKYVKVYRLN
jgi:3D (Asp-Asp-Asp) domain-containing protein